MGKWGKNTGGGGGGITGNGEIAARHIEDISQGNGATLRNELKARATRVSAPVNQAIV